MPFNIWFLIQYLLNWVTINQVLLHSLKARYKFYNSIIGILIFNLRVDRGNSEGIKDCKIFWERCYYFLVLSSIVSIKLYLCISLNHLSNNV